MQGPPMSSVPYAVPVQMPMMSSVMPTPMMSTMPSAMPSAMPTQSVQTAPMERKDDKERWNLYCKKRELPKEVADLLYSVILGCEKIILLCDDSDSMGQDISDEGTDPFANKNSTRWKELKRLAAALIDLITAIKPEGLDIYFLNRPKVLGVTTPAGLQVIFNNPPSGDTPLAKAFVQIYDDVKNIRDRNVLVICVTDGEPTASWGEVDPRGQLKNTIINKRDNIHISMAECTDQPDDMEYLDQWDGAIKNFDNTEDYREELMRVQNIQGSQFKFDYNDYVAKIVLATFNRWFFKLDQVKVLDPRFLRRSS
jgi:hypothetical protein